MSYVETLLSWNNVTTTKMIVLLLISVVGIICIFHVNFDFLNISGLPDMNQTCLTKCDHYICKKITLLRDSEYTPNSDIQPNECMFTSWEFSHVIFHIILGYFYNIYISITYSVCFELYEHYFYNCGSFLDLFWNGLGLLIGVTLRYYLVDRK